MGVLTDDPPVRLLRLAGPAGGVRGQGFLLARPQPPDALLALLHGVPAQRKPLASRPILSR